MKIVLIKARKNMKSKKIRTNNVNNRTYFKLKYPTYSNVLEREEEARKLRDDAQEYSLELRLIEAKIKAKTKALIDMAGRDDGSSEEETDQRQGIAMLRATRLNVETQGNSHVEEFQLDWVCRHLCGWNYASNAGDLAVKEDEALKLPLDAEELRAIEFDRRIMDALVEGVQSLYDGEEEKND